MHHIQNLFSHIIECLQIQIIAVCLSALLTLWEMLAFPKELIILVNRFLFFLGDSWGCEERIQIFFEFLFSLLMQNGDVLSSLASNH